MLFMHVYVNYGVVAQDIDIATCGIWLFLYIDSECWPWWHEVKGMSWWQSCIAQSYASPIISWWCFKEFDIWSHVDIEEIDATLSYLMMRIFMLLFMVINVIYVSLCKVHEKTYAIIIVKFSHVWVIGIESCHVFNPIILGNWCKIGCNI